MSTKPTLRTASLLCVALLTLAAACPTTRQVEDIVALSNAAVLDDPGALPVPPADAADVRTIVDKIDQLIASHPELRRANNALTMRKALLLLDAGQYNQAAAAFGDFDPAIRTNARDDALYEVHEALVWWWQVAGLGNLEAPPAAAHRRRIDALSATIAELSTSGIRYYLATLRAQMQRKYAELGETDEETATRLREGLAQYAAVFDEQARGHVRRFSAIPPSPQDEKSYAKWVDDMSEIPSAAIRWYAQTKLTYDDYAAVMERLLGRPPTQADWDEPSRWLANL